MFYNQARYTPILTLAGSKFRRVHSVTREIEIWRKLLLYPTSFCLNGRYLVSPFKPNEPSNLYEPISNFRAVGGVFHFYSNCIRTFCELTVETLIRCGIQQRLIWVCAFCLCPRKKRLGLYGLRNNHYKLIILKHATI